MSNIIILLGTLTGILLGAGWLLGGAIGIAIALGLAVAINGLSYWYADKFVLKLYNAKPFDDPKLGEMLSSICREAKIPVPKLYLVKSPIQNAFATGNHKQAVVAVTEGLLSLEDDEIEGILAHEVAHIKNRDMLVSTLAAIIAGTVAYIAQIGYFSLFFGNNRNQSMLPMISIIIFAPLAAFLVKLAITRSREYKADWTGALLTKKPEALASALKKISSTADENPIKGSAATAHIWVVNPFKRDWFNALFSTHPPIQKRIERLEIVRSAL